MWQDLAPPEALGGHWSPTAFHCTGNYPLIFLLCPHPCHTLVPWVMRKAQAMYMCTALRAQDAGQDNAEAGTRLVMTGTSGKRSNFLS